MVIKVFPCDLYSLINLISNFSYKSNIIKCVLFHIQHFNQLARDNLLSNDLKQKDVGRNEDFESMKFN